jgi:excinuclease UvrABC nuclease subunit
LYPSNVLPLDCGQEFDLAREEEFFAALPARSAVYVIEPRAAAAHPYLRSTANLRQSCERLLRLPGSPSKRLNLREVAARIRYRLTGSKFEQAWVLYQHARLLFPERYRELLRLRPPALLKVNLANEYPRCYVTRRMLSDGGFCFGPFPTRKSAEAFAQEFLNLFKMRRCQIKIRRDPSFPGCIYSEMKMCLAPCFAGCTKPEYDVEVSRVLGFLGSSGASLASEYERDREAASEALDFERASAAHKKLEKVASVLRDLPELARRVDELDAVILQRAAEENSVAVFRVAGGMLSDPFLLRFGELASQPRSAEEILREHLSGPARDASAAASDRAEHLSLLARWYYSKPRAGEIFFPQRTASVPEGSAGLEWPYRRVVRACARLLAPARPTLPGMGEPGAAR